MKIIKPSDLNLLKEKITKEHFLDFAKILLSSINENFKNNLHLNDILKLDLKLGDIIFDKEKFLRVEVGAGSGIFERKRVILYTINNQEEGLYHYFSAPGYKLIVENLEIIAPENNIDLQSEEYLVNQLKKLLPAIQDYWTKLE
ncbi:hypothetical protein GW765_03780 [Candidatus Parcubacteria bacterium]|nr:hypothetical protein [Candidatus Parcubacteria bacterium]